MGEASTLVHLIQSGGAETPAIRGPALASLRYSELRVAVAGLGTVLSSAGITRKDRVAILLPNGPELAVAFLGTAAVAVAAPLNPAYKRDEFDFYLGDLGARAILVLEDESGPIIQAAAGRGIELLRLRRMAGGAAGQFLVASASLRAQAGPPAPDPIGTDAALVLHTSGTTSRPKQVPLTHANLAASAQSIARTLGLSTADAGLNIMPLFHIHGLVASLLAPLAAGGAVICSSGFNALRFMALLQSERPTWYSAVPTMHQAILERASRQPEVARSCKLRFIRSSSASLPPSVFRALTETFDCPVIEAYGMTEASHQMASNPLSSGRQKSGSVGHPAGPEVRIATADGRLMDGAQEGEVVIRGPGVTAGYHANPKANADAFFNAGDGGAPWFRTGDLGSFDADGYLTISGRIKELINRGGEKVAPREVDEVLMAHPGVDQAVAFALPHAKLGEEVAAAVVLRQGAQVSEEALRQHAAERLAAFKVPRKIVIVAEIPKGATGKLQRIGLAKQLGLV